MHHNPGNAFDQVNPRPDDEPITIAFPRVNHDRSAVPRLKSF